MAATAEPSSSSSSSSSNDESVLELCSDPWVSKKYGFQLAYPRGWYVHDGHERSGIAAIFAPTPDLWDIKEQIHISVVPLQHKVTLDQFTELSVEELRRSIQQLSELNVIDSKLAGQPAKLASYKAMVEERVVRNCQCWTLKDDTAYVVTYTNTDGMSGGAFRRRQRALEKCFQSFQLLTARLRVRRALEDLFFAPLALPEVNLLLLHPALWKRIEQLNSSGSTPLKLAIEYQGPLTEAETEEVSVGMCVYAEPLAAGQTPPQYDGLVEFQFRKQGLDAKPVQTPCKMGEWVPVQYEYDLSAGRVVHTHLHLNQTVYTVSFNYQCAASDDRPALLLKRVLASFAPLSSLPRPPRTDVIVYESTAHHFRISYSPIKFQPAPGLPGSTIAFVAMYGGNVTFSVVVRPNNNGGNLMDLRAAMKRHLRNTVPGLEIDSLEPCELSKRPAEQLTYRGSLHNTSIRFFQVYSCTTQSQFALCYTAEGSQYNDHLPLAVEMKDSFNLLPDD